MHLAIWELVVIAYGALLSVIMPLMFVLARGAALGDSKLAAQRKHNSY